jgi:signal transduction histidine kinase
MRKFACLLLAFLALAGRHAIAGDSPAGTLELREARFWVAPNPPSASADAELPPTDAPWQAILLPYRWARDRPDGRLETAWIRLDFESPDPLPADPALYLSRLSVGGSVYVNGLLVADIRGSDELVQMRWRRPHLVRITPAALRHGANSILVRVASRDARTVFPSVQLGSEADLRALFDKRYVAEYSSAQFSALAGAVVAVFMLGIWWFRRSELLYLLFGLTCLFWALRTQTYLTEAIPWAWWWPWRALYYVWTGGFALSVAAFFLRYAGKLAQRWQLLLIGYALVGPLLLVASGGALQFLVERFWIAGLFVLEAYVLWEFYRSLRQQPRLESVALGGGALTTFVLGANDFAVRLGWLPYSNAYALHFGAPVVMVAMGGILSARFVRALRQVEVANVELTRKVDEKEQELRHQFERLREVERREESLTERQRIMQDMHDGLGSQLLTSLAAVERGAMDSKAMAQVLRDAMDDMRLAIDTLSPGREGLLEALGNLRYRLEPRFRAAGIDLRFTYRNLPDSLDVASEDALQILRILQESLANVLKHASGRCVEVDASLSPDNRLVLAIADDGRGFEPAAPAPGRGLAGMRRRAQRIGATLEIASSDGGSRITLAYPLARTG